MIDLFQMIVLRRNDHGNPSKTFLFGIPSDPNVATLNAGQLIVQDGTTLQVLPNLLESLSYDNNVQKKSCGCGCESCGK